MRQRRRKLPPNRCHSEQKFSANNRVYVKIGFQPLSKEFFWLWLLTFSASQ